MSEIFFILTIIYAAYVIHNSYKNSKHQSNKVKVQQINQPQAITLKNNSPKKIPLAAKAKKIELRTVLMKNPHTGEQVKVANNYRMVKRWIKEALVEEKLLDKIYKNNELNEQSKIIIAEALSIIKAMDKYKVSLL